MSSVAKSFFDITTGRSHGVIPTSDAVRIILNSGAVLTLDRIRDEGEGPQHCGATLVRAQAAWPPPKMGDPVVAKGERIDKALSALVGAMVLGETGVEVTEWVILPPEGTDVPHVRFGRVGVPLFTPKSDDDIAGLLISCVEMARRDQGNRINAVVVRINGRDEVGIACLPEKPEPPVGATLTGRRMVGGSPWADVPWMQVAGNELGGDERYSLIRRAVARVRCDCRLAGLDVPSWIPKLSLLGAGGQKLADGPEISWATAEDDLDPLKLEKIVREMTANSVNHSSLVSAELLRVTAVRRER